MTNRDSSQEFDPKHRIIGAVVVVVLAVILVPLILSQRETPPATGPVSSAVPGTSNAEETKVAVTKVPPPPPMLTAKPTVPSDAVSPSPPAASSPRAVPESVKSAVSEPKPAASATGTAGAVASKQPSANGSWVVQVGTFSNAENATRLEQKLRAEGQPVRAERVQLDSGKAVRLRVGPFADRAAALKAQERIQKDVGVKGVVLAYP